MKNQSKIIEFPLTTTTKTNVVVTKKRMKNIRLTVSKAGKVAVSMPYHTSFSYAYEFLMRKREWLNSQLNKVLLNQSKDACRFVNNGNIFLLGNNYLLIVEKSTKNKVIFGTQTSQSKLNISNELQNDTCQTAQSSSSNNLTQNQQHLNLGFTIYTKDLNPEFVKQVFLKWCKKYFLDFFTNRVNYIYSKIFNNTLYPTIKIKTMKSMWGNCNFVKRVITLNLYLAKARIECIDYVITHELAHLIHHNHSKDFHALMTQLMPDWKVRKKMLKDYSLVF